MQIYIHIPFCLAKCKYCAFNSIVADDNLIDEYISALCNEIRQTTLNQAVTSIYFGGGTPSILKISQFAKIFAALNANFNLNPCKEITVEVNPGTNLTYDYLSELKNFGVNRLSIGVQSFSDDLLQKIGRIHNSRQAIETVNLAKSIFKNVSIDLMYDLPNQTLKILRDTVTTALNLNVQHISIYGLEVEDGTEFGRLAELGQLKLPTDDESELMYEFITTELPRQGFRRYEISNFAISGFESQHNLGYWSDVEYIGFGVSAHSYINSMRYSNIANVKEYINQINTNINTNTTTINTNSSSAISKSLILNSPVRQIEEVVTKDRAMEEFCFLSLRKAEGISIKNFQLKFGESIHCVYSESIKKLIQQGLIDIDDEHIKLTERGMKYGNIAFAEFLI